MQPAHSIDFRPDNMEAVVDKSKAIEENGFWYMPSTILEKRVDWLVDSGAMSSLLNKNLFVKNFPDWMKHLEVPKRQLLAANGGAIKVMGEVEIPLTIGSQTFKTMVTVAELGNLDGIIGLNFLKSLGMKVDLGKGILNKEDWSIQLVGNSSRENKGCLVKLKESLCIPGRHEMTIMGYVEKRKGSELKGYCVLDPVQSLEEANVK